MESSALSKSSEYWDYKYQNFQECNQAPFDEVVSFVARHRPDKPVFKTRILEVGCGVGNNLLFLAEQGYGVYGIDISPAAIEECEKRFFYKKLHGDFMVRSFEKNPFLSKTMDLVIDRASLAYVPLPEMQIAIDEIHRVLRPGGKFLFTPYQTYGENRYFFETFRVALSMLPEYKWKVISGERVDTVDFTGDRLKESHYRIVAEKI